MRNRLIVFLSLEVKLGSFVSNLRQMNVIFCKAMAQITCMNYIADILTVQFMCDIKSHIESTNVVLKSLQTGDDEMRKISDKFNLPNAILEIS